MCCPKLLNLKRRAKRRAKPCLLVIGAVFLGWLLSVWISLGLAAMKPVDAVLVLGGSIQREIYAAHLAQEFPKLPILISHGAPDPCVRLIFEQLEAPIEQVWLERCARSTFQNFCFSIPTLKQWKAHHIKLVTSQTHLPRAQWLGQILLGAHRIWMEPEIVPETGIPGNRESVLKMSLDVTRSLVWAVTSQVHAPQCSRVKRLSDVHLTNWKRQEFRCESSQKFRELLK